MCSPHLNAFYYFRFPDGASTYIMRAVQPSANYMHNGAPITVLSWISHLLLFNLFTNCAGLQFIAHLIILWLFSIQFI